MEEEKDLNEELDSEEKVLDPDLIIGDDDAGVIDEEEIDPFKDKWEE